MEARFQTRMQECQSEQDMVDYLLTCIPVLREYTGDTTGCKETTHMVANMTIAGKKGVQRKDIYTKYMNEVEREFEPVSKHGKNTYIYQPCRGCGNQFSRYIDSSLSEEICTVCGITDYQLGEEVGYKEEQEMEKNTVYSYKRENHFNEWISQFQAKESTSVPIEVIDQLRSEFRKQKVKDLSEITHEKVKTLLKKLNFAKYYEHVPYIATIVSGITPPTMPQDTEDKLRLLFHKIQAPFDKHKPSTRKNFLSYSYTLFKMCELLGEDQYLPCFPLLKSREKLYIQDQIWEKICTELQWEFIKTGIS